jgi:hypothetical protein
MGVGKPGQQQQRHQRGDGLKGFAIYDLRFTIEVGCVAPFLPSASPDAPKS